MNKVRNVIMISLMFIIFVGIVSNPVQTQISAAENYNKGQVSNVNQDLQKSEKSILSEDEETVILEGTAAKKSTYIRSKPSTESEPREIVSVGEILKYSHYNNYWYSVKLGEKTGYIHKKHINPINYVETLEKIGIAKRDKTYIREKPSTKAKAAKTVPIGTIIEYETFSEYWNKVNINDETIGYIHIKHVEDTITDSKTITGVAQNSPTHIRDRASTKGKTLQKLPVGTILEYKSLSKYWFEVNIDGKTGYVHTYHVNPLEQVESIKRTGVTKKAPTNVRINPSTKAEVIKTYPIGSIIEYETFSTYWHKVKVGNQTGYVHIKHIENTVVNPESITGIAQNNPTNIRDRASTKGKTIQRLPVGMILEYKQLSKYWFEVNLEGQTGYVHTYHVKPLEQVESEEKTGVAKKSPTNIRANPSTKSDVIKTFPLGTDIEYTTFSTYWHKVKVGNETGYIHRNHVKSSGGSEDDPDMKEEPKEEVKQETKVEEIPFKTIEQEDPTLEKGKTKVKQEGKVGKKEIVYDVTYENGKEVSRKKVSEEITVEAVNKIVLVGTKEEPKEEVKQETKVEEIPFKTIEQEDPTLEKGKTKVKQEGKVGKKEVIYEVTYLDGKEVDRKKISENITEESVNKIILVGTKEKEEEVGNFAQEVLTLVNQERAKAGVAPLKLDSRLNSFAQEQSNYMYNNSVTEHSNIGQLEDKITASGIEFDYVYENVQSGARTPEQVVNDWMNSEGHKRSILRPSSTLMGLGHKNGYWTQIFVSN